MYDRTSLKDYLKSKPNAYKAVDNGTRNCVVYIGKTLVSTTGDGNASVLEVKCLLPGVYSYSGSITWYVSKDGSIYDVKNYWKQALSCLTTPIDDRSQNVYITLSISGYNQSYTLNAGFGNSASCIWALGLY